MSDLSIPRRATYEDYRKFPDDGRRYELLEGEIYMTPSPSTRHQYASKRLQRLLEVHFEGQLGYQVFNAPLDVILASDDVVQPDLIVVAEPTQITARGIDGAPLLLVEILSPSHLEYDRLTKARRYAARGVAHYWIVDPEARTLQCFKLQDGRYQLEASGADTAAVAVASFAGLTLPLAGLWLDV